MWIKAKDDLIINSEWIYSFSVQQAPFIQGIAAFTYDKATFPTYLYTNDDMDKVKKVFKHMLSALKNNEIYFDMEAEK